MSFNKPKSYHEAVARNKVLAFALAAVLSFMLGVWTAVYWIFILQNKSFLSFMGAITIIAISHVIGKLFITWTQKAISKFQKEYNRKPWTDKAAKTA